MTVFTQPQKWQPEQIKNGLVTIGFVPLLLIMGIALGTVVGIVSGGQFLLATSVLADVSMWFFTALLAMKPLNILFGWRWPLQLKRPLGLFTFLYAALHYFNFSSAFGLAVGPTVAATLSSWMLITGFVGLALMAPLALTSNRWSMRNLGKNWKRLHYLTYGTAVFIILHLLLLGQGYGFAALYIFLLAVRIPPIKKRIIQWRQVWKN